MHWKTLFFIFLFLVVGAAYWFYHIREPFKNTVPATAAAATAKKYAPKEGFNMIDREGVMLRGKQSNQIPALNTGSDAHYDNLEAGDKYVFSGNYSAA